MASSALNFVTINPKLQQSPKPTPPSHRFTTARRFLSSLRPIKASIFEKSPLSSIPGLTKPSPKSNLQSDRFRATMASLESDPSKTASITSTTKAATSSSNPECRSTSQRSTESTCPRALSSPPTLASSSCSTGKSFPVLFDLSKVEKKDLFTGTYMPSTDLTGGYRILSYLWEGQAKRNAGEGGISVSVLPTYRRYLPIPCSINRVAQIPARLPIPSVNGYRR
ncbi:unnamed protein product [Linum trigynum]|uniref:Uncharacterized protein n=1 Tax=Linum trigynum TaxID=586398 RepID=A0AAV2CSS9_9ROSI